MTVTLGSVPDTLSLNLTAGGDFIQDLESVDATGAPVDWLDEETLTLVFDNGDEWPAGLVGNVASWNVDKAIVVALCQATTYLKAKLVYTNDDLDIVWAQGSVNKL